MSLKQDFFARFSQRINKTGLYDRVNFVLFEEEQKYEIRMDDEDKPSFQEPEMKGEISPGDGGGGGVGYNHSRLGLVTLG